MNRMEYINDEGIQKLIPTPAEAVIKFQRDTDRRNPHRTLPWWLLRSHSVAVWRLEKRRQILMYERWGRYWNPDELGF